MLFSTPLCALCCGGFGGSAVLTQGGETPGGAGVAAALATGFAAAALTHAGPGDPAPGWRSAAERQRDKETVRQRDRETAAQEGESLARSTSSQTLTHLKLCREH